MDTQEARKKVIDMTDLQISTLIDDLPDATFTKLLKDAINDVCYDRTTCGMIGINYSHIEDKDMYRAAVYVGFLKDLL